MTQGLTFRCEVVQVSTCTVLKLIIAVTHPVQSLWSHAGVQSEPLNLPIVAYLATDILFFFRRDHGL